MKTATMWAQVFAAAFGLGMVALPASAGETRKTGDRDPTAESRSRGARTAYETESFAATIGFVEAIAADQRTADDWLRLAVARARLGRLVEALDAYDHLEETTAPGPLRRQVVAKAAVVRARLSWARVSFSSEPPEGAMAIVDQRDVPAARMASPYPVNPGWHTFLVEVEGRVVASRRVFFEEGRERPVLMRLDDSHPLTPPTGVRASNAAAPGRPGPDVDSTSGLRIASYASFAAGAVGLGVGVAFGIRAMQKHDEMQSIPCQPRPTALTSACYVYDPTGRQRQRAHRLRDERNHASAAASLGTMVALLGAASGIVLYVLSPDDETADAAAVQIAPALGFGSVGVVGRF